MLRPTVQITPEHLEQFALTGSPLLLNSLGRVFGLGQEEQRAIAQGGFPTWALVALAAGAGFLLGAYVHDRYPFVTKGWVGKD